ncbi:MAG TPA: homoserine dehydrogenase [Candidatus Fusicatenibacter merdavium]|uniref:Homoserine dehydrogenase n=1 Tax=Candidatus Fusicatenibacter merdavium TaxID=2838600 RepID=A0A9D1XBN0_9FIRM|nr:homoserine dehydrogenase [Candidatus Fusicatenibacter merdavium]
MVQIAVLGYGTVGSGVVEVIDTNHESINRKAGDEINIKYVLDLRDFPGDPVQEILVHDFETIINDPEVAIIVEVMGGLEPAYTFTKRALEAGKSVCTSNKELVAEHGVELLELARQKNINYLFEASCGGGIPIIRPLNSSLTADEIDEVTGILNGTTNYILTKMASDGSEFDEALKEAQNYGYAERNPEADVEGYDACRKIAILSSLAYGNHVRYEDIYTEGITKITAADIKYAVAMGTSIKLLATSRKMEAGFYAMVCPVMISKKSPLYSVNGVFNAIFIHGNVLGDAMFYGSGAGKLPTASAVVSDVVDCAKHLHRNVMVNWSNHRLELMNVDEVRNRFFVRVSGTPAQRKEEVEKLFGPVDIVTVPGLPDEFAFVTGMITERSFRERAEQIDGILSRIRARI